MASGPTHHQADLAPPCRHEIIIADTFPGKTHLMIEHCHQNDPSVAYWNDDGSSFIVRDAKKLASSHLSHYFKHSNYQSFVRQLNTYGFRGFNNAFYHESFRKGQPELVENIKRTNKKKKKTQEEQKTKEPTEDVSSLDKSLVGMEDRLRESMKQQMKEVSLKLDFLISVLATPRDLHGSELANLNRNGKRYRQESPNHCRPGSSASASDAESSTSKGQQGGLIGRTPLLMEKDCISNGSVRAFGKVAAASAGGTDGTMKASSEESAMWGEEDCLKQQHLPKSLNEHHEDEVFVDFINNALGSDEIIEEETGGNDDLVEPVEFASMNGAQMANNRSNEDETFASTLSGAQMFARRGEESTVGQRLDGQSYYTNDSDFRTGSFSVANAAAGKVHPAPVEGVHDDEDEEPQISAVVTNVPPPEEPQVSAVVTNSPSPGEENDEENGVVLGSDIPVTAVKVLPDPQPRFRRAKPFLAVVIVLILIAFIIWPILVSQSRKGQDQSGYGGDRAFEHRMGSSSHGSHGKGSGPHGARKSHHLKSHSGRNKGSGSISSRMGHSDGSWDGREGEGSQSGRHHGESQQHQKGHSSWSSSRSSSRNEAPSRNEATGALLGKRMSPITSPNDYPTMEVTLDGKYIFRCGLLSEYDNIFND